VKTNCYFFNPYKYATFETLATVFMKIKLFWNITPCHLVNSCRRKWGVLCLHLQCTRTASSKE